MGKNIPSERFGRISVVFPVFGLASAGAALGILFEAFFPLYWPGTVTLTGILGGTALAFILDYRNQARRRKMFDDSIKILEMPEHDCISLCVFNEHDGLFELGERIHAQYEDAYMNGYNWDALIRFYVQQVDPELMKEISTDPEAGMFAANISYSAENLKKMRQFEKHVRQLITNEAKLFDYIETHYDDIEWD